MKIPPAIIKLCKDSRVAMSVRNPHHIQFRGKILVNYYPTKGTVYVAGTIKGQKGLSMEDAIKMANEPPKRIHKSVQAKRGTTKKNKRRKRRLLAAHPFCCWCDVPLTMETATLEHIVPLARGGLDNMNNLKLACEPCNSARDCNMPEIEGTS